jgi:hypothetical protein
MHYLKISHSKYKKHDMFRPLSEVIIRHYKDETDKKLIQTYDNRGGVVVEALRY